MFILLVILIDPVFAQEAEVIINHIGFGENVREAYFTIHNSGEIFITDISLYVDGKNQRTIEATLPPKQGLQTTIYLDPGEHLIEVRTPEGAYDSLEITISATEEKTTIQPEEKLISLEENKMWIGTITLLVILVIGTWLLTKKPELKF